MREELITGILQDMMVVINPKQLNQLKEVLYMQLHKYSITEKSTDIMCIDKSYAHYLNLFLARKKTEGKSEKTLKLYHFHLSKLLDSLNKSIKDIQEDDLFCYLAIYKKQNQVSNGYLDHMRLVFSTFFTWLNTKKYIPSNPAGGLEPIKTEKKIKKPLSDEELEILRYSCERRRDLALLEFLYSTGVRVSELVSLDMNDIDFIGKEVIVFGKGSKERAVYLSAKACMHLKSYIESRTDDNSALFVSIMAPHNRLSVNGVEDIVRKMGRRVGIEKVHPHRFRRTMATNALKKGMALEEVKELLGHEKLDTTMIYCSVNKENVKFSHQKIMGA